MSISTLGKDPFLRDSISNKGNFGRTRAGSQCYLVFACTNAPLLVAARYHGLANLVQLHEFMLKEWIGTHHVAKNSEGT